MDREITGFRLDEAGDWVAVLDCGHPQHVRQGPPFTNRPWVTTEEGRRGRLGLPLDCVRCDRFELPPDFVPYKQTAVFTEATVPAALRREHTTRTGVWGKIVVIDGTLRYRVDALGTDEQLGPGRPGIVVPAVAHRVEPVGAVRFFVEFYRAPSDAGPP